MTNWSLAKDRLAKLAIEHRGAPVDLGEVIELSSTRNGEVIRISRAGDETVQIQAGWFINRFVDFNPDFDHVLEVVQALMTGQAHELLVLADDSIQAAGYEIWYPHGSLASDSEKAERSHVIRRPLPAWSSSPEGATDSTVPDPSHPSS